MSIEFHKDQDRAEWMTNPDRTPADILTSGPWATSEELYDLIGSIACNMDSIQGQIEDAETDEERQEKELELLEEKLKFRIVDKEINRRDIPAEIWRELNI